MIADNNAKHLTNKYWEFWSDLARSSDKIRSLKLFLIYSSWLQRKRIQLTTLSHIWDRISINYKGLWSWEGLTEGEGLLGLRRRQRGRKQRANTRTVWPNAYLLQSVLSLAHHPADMKYWGLCRWLYIIQTGCDKIRRHIAEKERQVCYLYQFVYVNVLI